ncbi:MAG: Phosphatidate cytidylyltransferase [Alphaproteobacteria bacterium MarineAlpha9_Bin7]|nr:MAG: Phosphatidate cytidylyltransferase [Alphaproteobacteria bacterium MarineAlpha9_Bin7]
MAAPGVNSLVFNNLCIRAASVMILAPTILFITWMGGGVFFLALVAVSILLVFEWDKLSGASDTVLKNIGFAILVGGALAAAWWYGYFEAFVVLVAAVTVATVLARHKGRNIFLAAFGPVYIILPILSLMWLRRHPEVGFGSVVWLFLVVWANDVSAYLIGGVLGGAKLAPNISPGKTWAGSVGGVICAGLVGGLASEYFLGTKIVDTVALGILLGAFIGIIAQIGDLGESWLKRRSRIKDSGQLIPGHGGLFDRIDGLIISAPILAFLVWLAE